MRHLLSHAHRCGRGLCLRSTRKAFTLIELLVVVLIIGILTTIALPQYQKAVARSRFSGLMPVAKTVKVGEEAYWLANSKYSGDLTEVGIDLPGLTLDENDFYHYGNGQNITVNVDSTHENVRMTTDGVDNVRYVAYFDKSAHFAGDTHCEALSSDSKAKGLCATFGKELGSVGSYTTYRISGESYGELTNAPARLVSANAACVDNTDASCVRKQYDDGSFVEASSTANCTYGTNGKKVFCSEQDHSEIGWYTTTMEYDPETGNLVKRVEYIEGDGGIFPNAVEIFDPQTGNPLSAQRCDVDNWGGDCDYFINTRYEYQDGKLTGKYEGAGNDEWGFDMYESTLYEYDEVTGKRTSETTYDFDGTIQSRTEYDSVTGDPVLKAEFSWNGNLTKYTEYGEDGAVYTFSGDRLTSYKDNSTGISLSFNSDGTVSRVSGKDDRDKDYSYSYNGSGNITSATGYDEAGNYFSVNFRSDGKASYASGKDENGNSYRVNYDSEGNITSYSEGSTSYYGDGKVSSVNVEEITPGTYTSNNYYYNTDGSFYLDGIVSDDYGDTWIYREYNSSGKLTSAYDNDSGRTYSFYENGSIRSVADADYFNYYEYDQSGNLDYDNSWVENGDIHDVNYSQDSWGVTPSTFGGDSAYTWNHWDTADTSKWKQQSDFSQAGMAAQGSWPNASTIDRPTYTSPGNHTYTESELNNFAVMEGIDDYSELCSDFSDAIGC